MRLVFSPIFCLLAIYAAEAEACSPLPRWQPHTPASAFEAAQVVVRAQVVSQVFDERLYRTVAKVRVIRVLKGNFEGDAISTTESAACGIGTFDVGGEYILFFPHAGQWFVGKLDQPWGMTPTQVLREFDEQPK